MITRTEAERLAAAVHMLRTDWPIKQLITLIGELQDWAYRDLGVALIHVALDRHHDGTWVSVNPYRVKEQGPWVNDNGEAAVARARAEGDRFKRLAEIRVRDQAIANCPACDERGYRNGIICDHDPDRPNRNAQLRAAARANIRSTITHTTEETTDA